MASIGPKRKDGTYRARYRDGSGREHARHFRRKIDAQQWLDTQTAALVSGTHVDPKLARTTVKEWCDTWTEGYATRRPSTVRQARVHMKAIEAEFGSKRLGDVRPSEVKAWTARMAAEGKAKSTVYVTYRRLAQIMGDAVHDGLIPRSPCSRRTSPGQPAQRPYVLTTDQVWAVHDSVLEHLRPAILLGAFVGLRTAEVVALRPEDVDFLRGVVRPTLQYPGEELKSEASRTAIPIPPELAQELSAYLQLYRGSTMVTDEIGRPVAPWYLEGAIRNVRSGHASPRGRSHSRDCSGCLVPGLSSGFRFHDLRHYFASLLIGSGADVKVVQKRLRHANATTTLNTYSHLWPDADESARAAVGAVLAARPDSKFRHAAD